MPDATEASLDEQGLSPMPGGGLTPSTPSDSPIGQALIGAGETAERIYRDYQLRQDSTAHLAGDNAMADYENRKFHDPSTNGLFTTHTGQKAGEAVGTALEDYRSYQSKVIADAPNDRAREMLERSANLRLQDLQHQAFRYQQGETDRYADEQSGAAIANAQQAIANDPTQANTEHQIERMRAVRFDDADRKGQPPEMVNQLVQRDTSAVWTGQITDAINGGQDIKARALYDAHRTDIMPEEQGRLAAALDISSTRAQAQKMLPGIVLDKDGQFDSDANIQQKLMKNREANGNPKLMDELQRQSDLLITQNKRAVGQQQDTAMSGAYKAMQQAGGDYNAIPPTVLAGLRPEQDQELRAWARKTANGEPVKDDAQTWLRINDVLSDPQRRNEAANLHLDSYIATLSVPSLKEFAKRQADLRNDASPDLTRDALINEIAKTTFVASGRTKPEKEDAQDFAQYTRRIRDLVSENEGDTKKPLNRADIQKIADDQLIGDVTGHGLFGGDVTTPRYKIAGAMTTTGDLGARVTPADMTSWGETLRNPHGPNFPANVATIQRWSSGVGDDGQPNPALPARARAIMDSVVNPNDRQAMVSAWRAKQGVDPTEAQLIAMWANHQKRTTPPPTAVPEKTVTDTLYPGFTKDGGWSLAFPAGG